MQPRRRVQTAAAGQQPGCLGRLLSWLPFGGQRVRPAGGPQYTGAMLVQPESGRAFEGWGTSLCWFANVVGSFPDSEYREQLMDLIFDPKTGLGLEICRYNIGGSGWDNRDKSNFRYGADIASFWGPDRSWDWGQDAGQRWVLLAARQRGASIFEAFSNSPPYWMTYSGRASGNRFPWLDNLRPDFYDDFVHYLTEVVRWYRDTHGLVFRTLDPFNEPSSNYWWAGNNQEGCHFGVATQNVILVKLQASLHKAGLLASGTGLSSSDETSIDVQVQTAAGYSPAALDCITQINTHCYQGCQREQLRDWAAAAGKRLWMSEVGFGSHAPTDAQAALDVARCVLADLNVMQAQAWVFWQAIENSDSPTWWGLVQVPFHCNGTFALSKQYFGLLQFSRFIRGGFSILDSNHPGTTLAALSPKDADGQALVLVVCNFDGEERSEEFDLSAATGQPSSVAVHRTSQQEDCAHVESFSLGGKARFSYSLPPVSITTLVVRLQGPAAA